VTVIDANGNEIKVGTKCVYGAPEPEDLENAIVEVIEISEPDVYYNPATDTDDGGYGVKITFRFKTGETDQVDAFVAPEWYRQAQWEAGEEVEVFQHDGDLEVYKDPHTHTHTIKDGKTVCVYCGEELEL